MKHLIVKAAAIATTVLLPVAVQAATANNTMDVSATVTRTCTVTAATMPFGEVAGNTSMTVDVGVAVECTAGSTSAPPSITVSVGANPDGAQRRMTKVADVGPYISYSISQTSGGTDLPAATAVAMTTPDSGVNYSTQLFGTIPASPTYETGDYTDTVTITVTYEQ